MTLEKNANGAKFGRLPKTDFDAEYLRFIKLDIAQAQAHLDDLPENQRRSLTLETLRHFGCGLYVKELIGEPKHLLPLPLRG